MPGADRFDIHVREKHFSDSRLVLRDVGFSAGPGEIVALLGRSGAGKSTLLRIVLDLDATFSGNVTRPGGRLGVVFQEPLLLPWLTVAENLRLVVTDGVPEPDVLKLLAAVGLAGAADRRPSALSLGMARRAALARALAVDPGFLVLDEPFASLDRQTMGMLGALLRGRSRARGTLVLVATHDFEHALEIADRVLILDGDPATLAADFRVPDGAREDLRREVLRRFPFLATHAPG